jgi:hypothetical protein
MGSGMTDYPERIFDADSHDFEAATPSQAT